MFLELRDINKLFLRLIISYNNINHIISLSGHGSSLSLVSSSSSLYSSQEEKQAAEIRKLRKELAEAQEKVGTLSNQLSTNVSCYASTRSLVEVFCRMASLSHVTT